MTSKKIGILPFLPSEMFTIPRFLSKENSPKSSVLHPHQADYQHMGKTERLTKGTGVLRGESGPVF